MSDTEGESGFKQLVVCCMKLSVWNQFLWCSRTRTRNTYRWYI